jgi:urease accessory protein
MAHVRTVRGAALGPALLPVLKTTLLNRHDEGPPALIGQGPGSNRGAQHVPQENSDAQASEARPPENRRTPPEWILWQVADSAFPVGGFAHSGGLEAAWQTGEIRGREDLLGFLKDSLLQVGVSVLPFVRSAYEAPLRFAEWDALCDVWISNHVANRASRLQGRAFWTAAGRAFFGEVHAAPEPGHLAPVMGVILGRLELSWVTASRLFLFLHLRGLISASVRLGIIGPLEAQSMQHGMAAVAEKVAETCAKRTLDQVAQTAPIQDLLQGMQDQLYSRLFQS